MSWLWAVGPSIIVCVAVWLAVGARRLARLRLLPMNDRPGTSPQRVSQLHENLVGLRIDLHRFGAGRLGDNDAGPVDR